VIVMIGFIAFVVNVEVPLYGDAISLGYAAGLLVYLSLDTAQPFPSLLIIALGGLLGGLLRAWWRVREQYGTILHFDRSLIEWPLMAASQLVLSLAVGDQFYRLTGGKLPLQHLPFSAIPPFAALIISSVTVYTVMYGLSLWWRDLDVR